MINNEETRLLEEYTRRDKRLPWYDWKVNIYHQRHAIGSLFHEHNQNLLVEVLNQLDLKLDNLRILDIGCGYGTWLRSFVELGAKPENCFGVDLSYGRINIAKLKNPAINWQVENLDNLSYLDSTFDIVLQVLVLSSILDTDMRQSGIIEMKRVLKKGGYILWIDLTRSNSKELVGFSTQDVINHFSDMQLILKKPVHPWYFRRLNGKLAWLARFVYQFIKVGCESQLIVLRKQ